MDRRCFLLTQATKTIPIVAVDMETIPSPWDLRGRLHDQAEM